MVEVAIDVIKEELLVIKKPIERLTIENVEDAIVELDPIKISEILNSASFSFQLLCFFL